MKAYQIETISSSQARFIDIPIDDLTNNTIYDFFPQEVFTVIEFDYSQVINNDDIVLYYTTTYKDKHSINGSIVLLDGMSELELIVRFIYRSIFKLYNDKLVDRIPSKDEIINKLTPWREE